MTFTPEQVELLKQPIDKKNVETRDGNKDGTFQLAYVEGWHVLDEANRIFGFDGWSCETLETTCIRAEPREVTYIARVRVTVGDVIREGTGAGTSNQTNVSKNHENAIKEAETDARKRALMTFGNQFGLSLYDGKERWKTHKPAKTTTTNANDTSTTYNMATKFLQGVSSINQLNSFKESVQVRHKEGKLTDMDKAKLENAIVQKEASLL